MDRRQRPFLKLTVYSLVAILIFGLIEFLFVGFIDAGVGAAGGGVGAAIALFNFIFITLIILAVIGLIIGLIGITIRYFERHDLNLFDDDRDRYDDDDDDDYRGRRSRRSTHR